MSDNPSKPKRKPRAPRTTAVPKVHAGPAAVVRGGKVQPLTPSKYPEVIDGDLHCWGQCKEDRPSARFPYVTRKGAGAGRLVECGVCWEKRLRNNKVLRAEGKDPVPAPRAPTSLKAVAS